MYAVVPVLVDATHAGTPVFNLWMFLTLIHAAFCIISKRISWYFEPKCKIQAFNHFFMEIFPHLMLNVQNLFKKFGFCTSTVSNFERLKVWKWKLFVTLRNVVLRKYLRVSLPFWQNEFFLTPVFKLCWNLEHQRNCWSLWQQQYN